MSNSTIAIPGLFLNLPFDIGKDFEPVSLVAIGPSVLTVYPFVAANSVTELIAMARAGRNSSFTALAASAISRIWRWNCCR